MDYRRFGDTLLVRIDRGEEILDKIRELAESESIKLASVSALGATNDFTVGVFNTAEKKYYSNEFKSAGNDKGEVFGGHLNRAMVSATCEMVVTVIDGEIDRYADPDVGLNLFKL